MACIVLEGAVALVLVLAGLRDAGLREAVLRAVPLELKLAIGVGIGLSITLVGLREGGIVVNNPATGIGLGELTGGHPLIALGGVLLAAILTARGARGAVLAGILSATVLGLLFGVLKGPTGILDIPAANDLSTIGDALSPSNLSSALTLALVPVIFTLFMTDFFDTMGTAVAVGSAGNLTDDRGELPSTRNVLLVDSAAAIGGGAMGVSSVTTYVESGAGVAEGARTGLASLVTAGLFALTVFLVPLIAVVGQGVAVGEATIHPAVAPALIMVGYLMLRLVGRIDWERPESALPAFGVIAGVPLTFSIAAGIGFGVLLFVIAMAAEGRAREVHPLMWALVPMFLLFFVADWLAANVF